LAALLTTARPAAAQRVTELGVVAMATAADPALVVGGITGALRTSLRTRVSAAVGVGGSGGDVAWRGELLAHFLLAPTRRDGAGLYGAAGIAAVSTVSTFRWTGLLKRSPSTRNWLSSSSLRSSYRSAR